MSIKHSTIVPLIGGLTLGQIKAFNGNPEYLLSYSPFEKNDSHLINYLEHEVPYYLLDKQNPKNLNRVDVISACCPCAGLSQFSSHYGDHNQNNKWLIESAKYVLNELKPEVFYGENAPGLAGNIGLNIRNQLYKIGREAGYSMTIYRTKSLFHGLPQVRERSFYFFWRGDKTPIMNFYRRDRNTIEDCIRGATGNTQREPINKKIPSEDPYYRFILEEIHGGITHREFAKLFEPLKARSNDVFSYIEMKGYNYEILSKWMLEKGYEKEKEKCEYKFKKISLGKNIMRRGTIIPRDYIGAFVGHYPMMLTHPDEDRYINYREAMTIMGLPQNFQLLNASPKNANHICQNVPVQTATDMATEVLEYLNGNREVINSTFTLQNNCNKTIEKTLSNDHLMKFFTE